MQKACGVKASQANLLLSHIADKLSLVINCMTSNHIDFPSMVEAVSGEESKKSLMSFNSGDDFQAYWDKINNGGK